MSFFSELEQASQGQVSDKARIASQLQVLGRWMALHPKALFNELRPTKPIFMLPGRAIVTRYTDVIEVLSRDQDFSVRMYAPKMNRASGPFFLGMEESPQYMREVSIMRLASNRDDLSRIAQLVEVTATKLVADARATGRLDIVGGLSRLVPLRLVGEYFGVPGPDQVTMLRWMRSIFADLFLNLVDDAAVREAALKSAGELSTYVDGLIAQRQAERQAGQGLPDDVLCRLIRMQDNPEAHLDNEGIRRNICGLIIGAIETTSESVANVMDFLLDSPALLAEAQAAARLDQDEVVAGYVYEALRFNPQAPFLYRVCERPTVLAKGTERETLIPAGTLVFAATLSAMFDPGELDAPETFNPTRPARHYLHFGYGVHTCFGRYINRIQIPRIVKAVLRQDHLQRASGDDGKVVSDGPFPDRMIVTFDAPQAQSTPAGRDVRSASVG